MEDRKTTEPKQIIVVNKSLEMPPGKLAAQVSHASLGAFFKSTEQILECTLVGMHACTLQADILMQMLTHPLTDAALEQFDNDWKALTEKLND